MSYEVILRHAINIEGCFEQNFRSVLASHNTTRHGVSAQHFGICSKTWKGGEHKNTQYREEYRATNRRMTVISILGSISRYNGTSPVTMMIVKP